MKAVAYRMIPNGAVGVEMFTASQGRVYEDRVATLVSMMSPFPSFITDRETVAVEAFKAGRNTAIYFDNGAFIAIHFKDIIV